MEHRLKRIFYVLLVSLGLLILAVYSATVPQGVREAALKGLKEFPMLRAEILQAEAGKTLTSPPSVSLGEFFQVHTVKPDELLQAPETQGSFSGLIRSTPIWRVVVMVNGEPNSLLTVEKRKGRWTAVAWGGKELAKELYSLRKEWPAPKFKLRFIRIYQARADVIEVLDRTGKKEGYVPLVSARIALNLPPSFDPQFIISEPRLLKNLKEIVRENFDFRK